MPLGPEEHELDGEAQPDGRADQDPGLQGETRKHAIPRSSWGDITNIGEGRAGIVLPGPADRQGRACSGPEARLQLVERARPSLLVAVARLPRGEPLVGQDELRRVVATDLKLSCRNQRGFASVI